MSSTLMRRAQITILARLLGTSPDTLASLEHLEATEIAELRQRISDELFDELAPIFARVSKVAPLVPDALAAKMALKILPPEVAGRGGGAVGLDHLHRAPALIQAMTPEYLADAAPYIDPRVIPAVVPSIDGALLIPAARELLRRRDYVTASMFVEHATPGIAKDLEPGLDDDEGIIATAALVMSDQRIDEVLQAIPAERLGRMGRTIAAASADIRLAALSVLPRLRDEFAAPIVESLVDELDDAGLSGFVTDMCAVGADAELAAVTDLLDGDRRARFAEMLGRFGDDAAAS
jgi:hypothetical protein